MIDNQGENNQSEWHKYTIKTHTINIRWIVQKIINHK